MSADCVQDNVYVLTQANAYVFLLNPGMDQELCKLTLTDLLTMTSLRGSQKPKQLKKPPITTQSETAPDVTARASTQGRHDAYLLKGLSQFHREDELMLQN